MNIQAYLDNYLLFDLIQHSWKHKITCNILFCILTIREPKISEISQCSVVKLTRIFQQDFQRLKTTLKSAKINCYKNVAKEDVTHLWIIISTIGPCWSISKRPNDEELRDADITQPKRQIIKIFSSNRKINIRHCCTTLRRNNTITKKN